MKIALRGGSWLNEPWFMHAMSRVCSAPSFRDSYAGFRCAQRGARPLVGLRGGSWSLGPGHARAAHPHLTDPKYRSSNVGFRCCVRRERS